MTVSELTARVEQRIDDDTTAPATVQPGEILAALNEGQDLASWLTLCLESVVSWTLPSLATFLSIRATFPDFLVPLRLEIAGARIRPATVADLDAENSNWQATVGTPKRYFTFGWNFAGVTPQPLNDTVATLTYARAPVQLVGDAFPELPVQYDESLICYAIYKVRLKEGAQGLERGLKYLNKALDDWTELGDFIRNRSRAARYDVLPWELRMFDRSRLAAPKPPRK